MTLPSSGPISMYDVNIELGYSGTVQISLNDAAVRSLFGVASGQISLSDGYGKSNVKYWSLSTTFQQAQTYYNVEPCYVYSSLLHPSTKTITYNAPYQDNTNSANYQFFTLSADGALNVNKIQTNIYSYPAYYWAYTPSNYVVGMGQNNTSSVYRFTLPTTNAGSYSAIDSWNTGSTWFTGTYTVIPQCQPIGTIPHTDTSTYIAIAKGYSYYKSTYYTPTMAYMNVSTGVLNWVQQLQNAPAGINVTLWGGIVDGAGNMWVCWLWAQQANATVHLSKFDSSGNNLLNRCVNVYDNYPSNGTYLRYYGFSGFCCDSSNNVYIVGSSPPGGLSGANSNGALTVFKFDSTGTFQWKYVYTNVNYSTMQNDAYGNGVGAQCAVTPDGTRLIVLYQTGLLSLSPSDGSVQWCKQFVPYNTSVSYCQANPKALKVDNSAVWFSFLLGDYSTYSEVQRVFAKLPVSGSLPSSSPTTVSFTQWNGTSRNYKIYSATAVRNTVAQNTNGVGDMPGSSSWTSGTPTTPSGWNPAFSYSTGVSGGYLSTIYNF